MSQRAQEDEVLACRICQAHQASHQIYGSRRPRAELATQGTSCGRKRVVRLMHLLGLNPRPRHRRMVITNSQHRNPMAANGLIRNFTAGSANTKWVTDIIGVWTAEGWL